MKKIGLSFFLLAFMTACSHFKKPVSDLPAFNLLMLDSTTIFNTKNIPNNQPGVLLFFSPSCEHCQKETESILNNMDSLKYLHFYFITIDAMDEMKTFNGYYKLFKYPNITLGQDYTYFFPSFIKDLTPPCAVVYDKYKCIRAVFKGETSASQIISLFDNI